MNVYPILLLHLLKVHQYKLINDINLYLQFFTGVWHGTIIVLDDLLGQYSNLYHITCLIQNITKVTQETVLCCWPFLFILI